MNRICQTCNRYRLPDGHRALDYGVCVCPENTGKYVNPGRIGCDEWAQSESKYLRCLGDDEKHMSFGYVGIGLGEHMSVRKTALKNYYIKILNDSEYVPEEEIKKLYSFLVEMIVHYDDTGKFGNYDGYSYSFYCGIRIYKKKDLLRLVMNRGFYELTYDKLYVLSDGLYKLINEDRI